MSDDPKFLMNFWEKFEEQLNTLFGDPNKLLNLENQLEALIMRESEHSLSYIPSFRTLKFHLIGWTDNALMFACCKGLPSRILDLLNQKLEPISTLSDLVNATLKRD